MKTGRILRSELPINLLISEADYSINQGARSNRDDGKGCSCRITIPGRTYSDEFGRKGKVGGQGMHRLLKFTSRYSVSVKGPLVNRVL